MWSIRCFRYVAKQCKEANTLTLSRYRRRRPRPDGRNSRKLRASKRGSELEWYSTSAPRNTSRAMDTRVRMTMVQTTGFVNSSQLRYNIDELSACFLFLPTNMNIAMLQTRMRISMPRPRKSRRRMSERTRHVAVEIWIASNFIIQQSYSL